VANPTARVYHFYSPAPATALSKLRPLARIENVERENGTSPITGAARNLSPYRARNNAKRQRKSERERERAREKQGSDPDTPIRERFRPSIFSMMLRAHRRFDPRFRRLIKDC